MFYKKLIRLIAGNELPIKQQCVFAFVAVCYMSQISFYSNYNIPFLAG